MKKFAPIAEKWFPGLSIGLLFLLWEGAVRWFHIPAYILPAPSQVLAAMWRSRSLLLQHTGTTLTEAILGLLLAVAVAFIMAFAMHSLSWLYQAVYPLLILSQTIPLIVLAILLPLWLGWGMLPKVVIVVLVCFFPVVISLLNGLAEVDPDQINLFRSMGASTPATFFMVKMPAALPSFFTGVRIAATYSIMAAIIGEWVGAKEGLGYYMTVKQKAFAIDEVLGAVLIICAMSYLLVKIIDLLHYWAVPWNRCRFAAPPRDYDSRRVMQ